MSIKELEVLLQDFPQICKLIVEAELKRLHNCGFHPGYRRRSGQLSDLGGAANLLSGLCWSVGRGLAGPRRVASLSHLRRTPPGYRCRERGFARYIPPRFPLVACPAGRLGR